MRKPLLLLAPAAIMLTACGSSSAAHTPATTAPTTAPVTSSAVTSGADPTTGSAGPVPSTSRTGSNQSLQVLELVNASTYTPSGGQPKNGGPTGQPGGGDQWAFTSILQQNGSPVGTDHVNFVFAANGTATVTAAESFANGQITAHGTIPFDRTIVIPITAGTGAYSGTTGTLTVVSNDPTHNNLSFNLT